MSYDALDSDFLKGLVETGTKALEIIDKLIDSIGVFKTALIGVGTVIGSQKLGLLNYSKNGGWGGLIPGLIKGSPVSEKTKSGRTNIKFLNAANEFSPKQLKEIIKNSGGIDNLADKWEVTDSSVKSYVNDIAEGNIKLKEGETLLADYTKRNDALTKIGNSIGNIGAQFVSTIVNGAVSMLASAALSSVIQSVQNWINSYELLAQKTEEISAKYNEQKNQLNDYSNKIGELITIRKSETSTSQEVKDATSQLYEIQNNLIQQYPEYASSIDLVNGSLEEQRNILQDINKYNSERALDEINAQRSSRSTLMNIGSNIFNQARGSVDLFSGLYTTYKGASQYFKNLEGGDNIWEAFKKSYTEQNFNTGEDIGLREMKTSAEQIKEIYEDYSASFSSSDNNVLSLLKSYQDVFQVNGEQVKVVGSIDKVNEAVSTLRIQLKSLGMENNEVFKSLDKIAIDTQDKITKFGTSYNTIIENEILNNDDLASSYNNLTDKYNKYIDAQNSGDIEKVEKATQEYIDIFAEMFESGEVEEKYLTYFKNLYPELQAEISKWEFEAKVKLDLGEVPTPETSSYDDELQKLEDWGLSEYSSQIRSGALHQFGNIDMDKRTIIKWSDELKKVYQDELASWDYNPEVGGIDTVFGGTESFNYNGGEHQIAFSPILQTDKGPIFLGKSSVEEYINSVLAEASKDGNITADEILEIDATGTGYQVGDQLVHGLIAAIDSYEGIGADIIGKLMHFSGEYGAFNLAEKDTEAKQRLASDIKRNSAEEIWNRYNYVQATKDSGLVDQETIDEFDALTEAATNAGMGVQEYINSVKQMPQYSDNMQHLRELMGENWSEDFEKEFADKDLSLLVDIKPKPNGLSYTKKEIEDILSPVEVDVEAKVKSSSAVDSMAEAKSAFASLGGLYDQTVRKIAADGQATGYADPALLNSVESAFSKFVQEANDKGDVTGAAKINSALETFEDTLVKFPNDADKAQEAINHLVTAYIDQTDVIKNLTDENKEWSIAQLKAMGVTNAEEVVMSRLNSRVKQLMNNMKKLTSTLNDMPDVSTLTPDSQEIKDVKTGLDEAFKFDMPDGETFTPDFDPEWIIENMELIKKAASEDVEAVRQLQVEAAKQIVTNIDINAPTPEAVNGIQTEINNLISGFDIENVEVGTYIDQDPMIRGLNQLVAAGTITRNSMNKILAGIGVEPEITKKYESIDISGLKGSAAAAAQQTVGANAKVGVPIIKYKVTGGAAPAQYAGGNTNQGSKGGSPSGNKNTNTGNKSNKVEKDTKETFDWIQVRIQRLEEAINRLDKVNKNVFKNWTKRNKAVSDEIKKVTEEIEAQRHAEERYLKNANKITNKNTNTKPKAKDYEKGKKDKQYKYDKKQYKKAQKAWETGEYQKKIREGKIGKGDIEKIQNKYLVNLINEYTEIYQKSIDSKDAADDLTITLSELNKVKFDNIKSEFENLTTTIEKQMSIIDERINRTQEAGYWVSDTYYNKQLKLEDEHFKKLEKERDRLIKQLNEQVSLGENNGGVDYQSEAWYEMYHAIMDVNEQMEQSLTNVVKLNNEIRQLKWDQFDYLQERLKDINNEAETLITLLSANKIYDEWGNYTNRGWANAALISAQYAANLKALKDYQKEREELEKKIEKDPHNTNLRDRWQVVTDAIRDTQTATVSLEEAEKSLVEGAINQHLEKLQELMNQYKETMSAAKDLYDWQKNVSDQTKNITNLQKQLTAYGKDTSESGRKRRQDVRNQLKAAQEQLRESEWDRYINQTNQMLDNLYGDYEKVLNARLDNIETLFKDEMETENQNGDKIAEGLKEIQDIYGFKTDNFKNFLGENRNIVDSINSTASSIETTIKKMWDENNGIPYLIEKLSKDIVDYGNGKVGVKDSQPKPNTSNGNSSNSSVNPPASNAENLKKTQESIQKANELNQEKKIVENSIKNLENQIQSLTMRIASAKDKDLKKSLNTEKTRLTSQLNHYKSVLASIEKELTEIVGTPATLVSGVLGYKTGASHISKDQMAWTQEKRSEIIFRKSDGAMLTPLGRGDMVFTNAMSQRLWDIAQGNMPNLIGAITPPTSGSNNMNVTTNNDISIVLPNVQDYDSFKTALQNDTRFEKFIKEVTVGQLWGNNTLRKNKY